jgi:hypothetical protein
VCVCFPKNKWLGPQVVFAVIHLQRRSLLKRIYLLS